MYRLPYQLVRCVGRPDGPGLRNLAHRSLASKARKVDLKSLPPPAPPVAPPGLSDEEHAGRDLAKLALIAQSTRAAIAEAGARGHFTPDLLVDFEAVADESLRIVTDALEASGRPCTPEQLASRVNKDFVPIPADALDYKQYLRVGDLRDELENCLVAINVTPPSEALIDGAGKPFCRLDRRALKRRQFEESEALSASMGVGNDQHSGTEQKRVMSKIPVVSADEITRRKAKLESSAKIENVLKGFDTALLEVGRVHKVTRGGTNMNMRALVVIGNRKGTAGYGEGKSDSIPHAIERACRDAKRNLLYLERFNDRTVYHSVVGNYVQSKVSIWPVRPGGGISANNNFSAVFQLFGMKDIGAKLHGPRSVANSIKALFNGLAKVSTAEEVASRRGLGLALEPLGKNAGDGTRIRQSL